MHRYFTSGSCYWFQITISRPKEFEVSPISDCFNFRFVHRASSVILDFITALISLPAYISSAHVSTIHFCYLYLNCFITTRRLTVGIAH